MINISTKGEKSPGFVSGDYIDNSTNINVKPTLAIFDQFRKLFHNIKTPVRHYLDNPTVDFNFLADRYFENTYTMGQQITVEGFLSKYLLTHRSNFHVPFTQKAGKTLISPAAPLSGKVEMEIQSYQTQLPVQCFPYAIIGGRRKYIYFLYQPDFKSFALEKDSQKEALLKGQADMDCILQINSTIKPIVIIASSNLIQKAEKVVRITGILNEFDLSTASVFLSHLSTTQLEILGNSFRPYSESVQSLCIDLSEESSRCKLSVLNSIQSLPATIYAETHFENTERISNYSHYIGDMLPNAYPGLHWASFNSNKENISCGLCDSSISVITKSFVQFAYYVESDLANPALYRERLTEIRDFIDTFRKNVRNFYQKHTGLEIINIYDFVFDYSKASFFHPKGIMSSYKSQESLKEDVDMNTTMYWLRNNNE